MKPQNVQEEDQNEEAGTQGEKQKNAETQGEGSNQGAQGGRDTPTIDPSCPNFRGKLEQCREDLQNIFLLVKQSNSNVSPSMRNQ